MSHTSLQTKPTIAIIDDTPEDLYITRRILEKHIPGISIKTFSLATDTITYLENNSSQPGNIPDIIFVDIHMPQMNGFEFLDAFSKLPETVTTKCKVHMLSSSFNNSDIERASAHAYSKSFIEKPITSDLIRTIVSTHELRYSL